MRHTPTPSTPQWPGVLAFGLALLGGALAISAATGWPFGVEFGPVRVSVRSPRNPALGALVCFAFSYWWLGGEALRAVAQRLEDRLARHAGFVAAALAVAVVAMAWQWGALVAGGTDSSGYLNQARLWRAGTLRAVPPRAEGVRFVNELRAITPVGFRTDATGQALAPVYPPGYPMAMALVGAVGGDAAQFLVVPLAAGLLTGAAFLTGRMMAGPVAGLAAAAATASSPIVLYQAFQPMSDVPAASAWLVAIAALALGTRAGDGAAAMAAVGACLIRPNLFALAPLLVLAALWWSASWTRGIRRALAMGFPVVIAAVAFAWWQRWLYGEATETGYGAVRSLFSPAHVWPNLVTYTRWLIDSHGYTMLPGVLAPFLLLSGVTAPHLPRPLAVRMASWSIAMCAALLGFYALYLPFDNWTYTRFLLPALPLAFGLGATTLVALVSLLPQPWRTAIVVLALVWLPCTWWARAREAHAFAIWDNERRYTEVAEFAAAQPAASVFICMQHSGSLAYYTSRPLVRWDWLEPAEADRAIAALAAAGHAVYAVLDDWEVAAVQSRFPGSALAASVQAPVFRSRQREAIATLVFLVRPAAPVSGR